MDFQPKTEEQLKAESLAPAGDYDFEVLSAEDLVSAKGNPMLKLRVGLYIGDRIGRQVYDYIVPQMGFKLRHFCDTVGLLSRYEDGSLCASDCKGRSGKVKIIQEEGRDGYPPKNAVKDYIARAAKPLAEVPRTPVAPAPKANKDEDDNLPF